MRLRRNPMLRWVDEYLLAPSPRPSAEERCAKLEAEMEAFRRRLNLLGESVARAHEYDEAS